MWARVCTGSWQTGVCQNLKNDDTTCLAAKSCRTKIIEVSQAREEPKEGRAGGGRLSSGHFQLMLTMADSSPLCTGRRAVSQSGGRHQELRLIATHSHSMTLFRAHFTMPFASQLFDLDMYVSIATTGCTSWRCRVPQLRIAAEQRENGSIVRKLILAVCVLVCDY